MKKLISVENLGNAKNLVVKCFISSNTVLCGPHSAYCLKSLHPLYRACASFLCYYEGVIFKALLQDRDIRCIRNEIFGIVAKICFGRLMNSGSRIRSTWDLSNSSTKLQEKRSIHSGRDKFIPGSQYVTSNISVILSFSFLFTLCCLDRDHFCTISCCAFIYMYNSCK